MGIFQNLKTKSPKIDIKKIHFIEGLDLENIHTKVKTEDEWRTTIFLYLPIIRTFWNTTKFNGLLKREKWSKLQKRNFLDPDYPDPN